jgi:hypothetical protein
MRTSERPSQQEIMRCVVESGHVAGLHLAALERQKSALAVAERHRLLKEHPAVAATSLAERPTPRGAQVRLSRWLGSKLISAGLRLTGSPA